MFEVLFLLGFALLAALAFFVALGTLIDFFTNNWTYKSVSLQLLLVGGLVLSSSLLLHWSSMV